MPQFTKERYTLERARELGIRGFENSVYVGVPNGLRFQPDFRDYPPWIYYVEVCDFTFAFYSLAMIQEYIDFYSLKDIPSTRHSGKFSDGPAASTGDGQSRFERLPLRLRKGSKRLRVVKALRKALEVFADAE